MRVLNNGRVVVIFSVLLFFGTGLVGCATTAQLKALEEKTQKAMETAEQALKEAQSAKALEEKIQRAEETAVKASRLACISAIIA